MKIKTLGPPPPRPPRRPRPFLNLVFSPVFQYFALAEAFLQPRGSIFWILEAQKSTSAAQGKHILDFGTPEDAKKLWPRPPSDASSQCCRWPRRASERPPPRKGAKNRFFPCFIALGRAEGICRAQQKHTEGSGTLKRGGRADRSSQNTGPRRVFLRSGEAQSRHGHGQGRVGGKEQISELLMQVEKQKPSRRRQDIFSSKERDARSMELDKRASMAWERGRVGWRFRLEKQARDGGGNTIWTLNPKPSRYVKSRFSTLFSVSYPGVTSRDAFCLFLYKLLLVKSAVV